MINLGYVRKDSDSNKYRLTFKLFEISGRVVAGIDTVSVAKPYLERLRNETNEAIHLVVRDGIDIVYVHKVEANNSSIHMFSRIGMRRPMYCTAVGKSILATMSDGHIKRIWDKSDIKQYTQHTIIRLENLYQELEQVRRLGYALDNEENELGVRCIGTAVLDYSGRAAAALSISAPLMRMTDQRIEELAQYILKAREDISSELGYRGN